jgi:hypothetical protein
MHLTSPLNRRSRDRSPRRVRQQCCTAIALAAIVLTASGTSVLPTPDALAAPNPELEFLYDVSVRRQYAFPNNDPVGYGHSICDELRSGKSYKQIMSEVAHGVAPNDEFAVNYLVSNAVNLLCPELISQLRTSAAGQ